MDEQTRRIIYLFEEQDHENEQTHRYLPNQLQFQPQAELPFQKILLKGIKNCIS